MTMPSPEELNSVVDRVRAIEDRLTQMQRQLNGLKSFPIEWKDSGVVLRNIEGKRLAQISFDGPDAMGQLLLFDEAGDDRRTREV